MPKKQRVWYYTVDRAELDRLPVDEVLDMLRYDGARVESNAPEGRYLLSTEFAEPHVARWRSFGVRSIRQWDKSMGRPSDEPFLDQVFDEGARADWVAGLQRGE